MECVEGALKGSFRKEMALKFNQQPVVEDVWAVNGTQNGGVSMLEDFSVDDLLDFSTKDEFLTQELEKPIKEDEEEEEEEELVEEKTCPHPSEVIDNQNPNNDHNFSLKEEDFGSGELSVPADDAADLEWLSHFVEDSFSEYSLTVTASKPKSQPGRPLKPETISQASPNFSPPAVPSKARSKRHRKSGWCLGSPTESSTSSSSSTSSNSSSSTPWLIYTKLSHNSEPFFFKPPPVKKQRKKLAPEAGGAQPQRRCSHCGVQKTPQWRAGPLGAKTLCNACGVRFKSGRLLPEYRPACSPTFSSEIHSNHHRKVLEMRRKKESQLPDSGVVQAVQSF